MATTEKVGILMHSDSSGNMSLIYPVTTVDAVDGIEEMRDEIENSCKDYANSKHINAQVTLYASQWSSTAPYTQTVNVTGFLSTDRPHYGVIYSSNKEAEKESFAMVDDLDTSNGKVTFSCFTDKPTVNLTIQLEVNR